MTAEQLARFAELVFAYIDQLSAASVAGHTDELAHHRAGCAQRNLERLARAAAHRRSRPTLSSPPPSGPTGSRRRR